MRLFVGIAVGDAVAAAAAELIRALESRVRETAPHARITWVAPERLHLTVRFIGAADDAKAAAIAAHLEPSIAIAPFWLSFARTGVFPPRGAPRVIWAGIGEGGDDLAAVEREVTSRLTTVGIPPESRPYRPHLTIARVREPAGLRAAIALQGFADRALGGTSVEAITLFESRLSPKGPTYVPLQRTRLVR